MKKLILSVLIIVLTLPMIYSIEEDKTSPKCELSNYYISKRHNELRVKLWVSNYKGNIPIVSYEVILKITFNDGEELLHTYKAYDKYIYKFDIDAPFIRFDIGDNSVRNVVIHEFNYKKIDTKIWKEVRKERRYKRIKNIIIGTLCFVSLLCGIMWLWLAGMQ